MPRELYHISPTQNLDDLIVDLNNTLQKITVQLQRIEGLGGYTTELFGPIKHTGSTAGFYSATPVAQQAAITDLSATPSDAEIQTAVNALIETLENLGVIASA
jgi:hypothetical protein